MPTLKNLFLNSLVSLIFIACALLHPVVSMQETGWLLNFTLLIIIHLLVLKQLWQQPKLGFVSVWHDPLVRSFIGYLSVLAYGMIMGWYHNNFYMMSQASFNFLIFLPLCALPLLFKDATTYKKYANFWLLLAGLSLIFLIIYVWVKYDFTTIRLTNYDIRTTYPWLLTTIILPAALLYKYPKHSFKFLWLLLIISSFIAIVLTNTRTYLCSAVLGFGFVSFYYFRKKLHRSNVIIYSVIIIGSTLVLLVSEPHLRHISYNGLNRLTFSYFNLKQAKPLPTSTAMPLNTNADWLDTLDNFSNGRLENEWASAYQRWQQASLVEKFLGIGIGSTFKTHQGESQNYIHNILLYCLVYYGILGTFLCLLFYWRLVQSLWRLASVSDSARVVGMLGLLLALLAFAQLFPIYNLLPFNLSLSIIISFAFLPQFFKPKTLG